MGDGNFTGFPFAVGSVVGVRAWRFTSNGVLTGITYQQCHWAPGVNDAECMRKQHSDECLQEGWWTFGGWHAHTPGMTWRPTMPDCKCPTGCGDMRNEQCSHGWWMYNNPDMNYGGEIAGIIEGFGLTTEGSKGSRCTKARIVALCLPPTPPVRREFVDDREYTRKERIALAWKRSKLPGPRSVYLLAWRLEADIFLRRRTHTFREHLRLSRPGCVAIAKPYADKIRANYPDVKIYDDVDDMLAAHPLSPPPSKEAPNVD